MVVHAYTIALAMVVHAYTAAPAMVAHAWCMVRTLSFCDYVHKAKGHTHQLCRSYVAINISTQKISPRTQGIHQLCQNCKTVEIVAKSE